MRWPVRAARRSKASGARPPARCAWLRDRVRSSGEIHPNVSRGAACTHMPTGPSRCLLLRVSDRHRAQFRAARARVVLEFVGAWGQRLAREQFASARILGGAKRPLDHAVLAGMKTDRDDAPAGAHVRERGVETALEVA